MDSAFAAGLPGAGECEAGPPIPRTDKYLGEGGGVRKPPSHPFQNKPVVEDDALDSSALYPPPPTPPWNVAEPIVSQSRVSPPAPDSNGRGMSADKAPVIIAVAAAVGDTAYDLAPSPPSVRYRALRLAAESRLGGRAVSLDVEADALRTGTTPTPERLLPSTLPPPAPFPLPWKVVASLAAGVSTARKGRRTEKQLP